MAGARTTDKRPLSPHLQVWRWHVTMATSILHRATGVGNYIGAFVFVAWLVALAAGPEAYAAFSGILFGPLGLFVLFGLTLSYSYHLCNGIRHLVWDTGHGLSPAKANASGWTVIVAGVVIAAGVIALAFLV